MTSQSDSLLDTCDNLVLDAHTHCGFTVPFEELSREWRRAGIDGGVVFSPVEEIYNRYDPWFTDSPEYKRSRTAVHDYLIELSSRDHIYPYFFVWNDFATIPDDFVGIKWHRHADEPTYNYESPQCGQILERIRQHRLPIVLEEEFRHTLEFVERIAHGTVVIIPHMGGLNGGYHRLKDAGVFDEPNIWADTALAGRREILDFAESYGIERLMFGSDYPFGIPDHEKRKVTSLFADEDLESVLAGNLLRLMAGVRKSG